MLASWKIPCATLVGVLLAAGHYPVESSYSPPSLYHYEAPWGAPAAGAAPAGSDALYTLHYQQPTAPSPGAGTLPRNSEAQMYYPRVPTNVGASQLSSQPPSSNPVNQPTVPRDYQGRGHEAAEQGRNSTPPATVRGEDAGMGHERRNKTHRAASDSLSQIQARLRALNLEEQSRAVPTRGLKTMLAATSLHGLSIISMPVALALLGLGAYRFLSSKREQKMARKAHGGYLRNGN